MEETKIIEFLEKINQNKWTHFTIPFSDGIEASWYSNGNKSIHLLVSNVTTDIRERIYKYPAETLQHFIDYILKEYNVNRYDLKDVGLSFSYEVSYHDTDMRNFIYELPLLSRVWVL